MPSAQFTDSVAANIAFWSAHKGLDDERNWSALDRERENLFRATVFGLQLDQTVLEATELALSCYTYVFERGYWREWIPVLEQALAGCPDDDLALKGRLLHQLGCLCRKERRLDEALAFHRQEEVIGRRLDDPIRLGLAHCHLGNVYQRQRQYVTAEQFAQKALAELEAGKAPPDQRANVLNLLGIIAQGRGNWPVSDSYLRQACELFRLANKPIEVGRTLGNLCNTLEFRGQVDEALDLLAEAIQIFETYDLQIERARLFQTLGTLHFKQGDLSQAEAAFRQADTPAMRRSGPAYLQSLTEMNLGNVLLNQGRIEESRAYFADAVAGFRRVEARTLLANSLDGLAETSLALGDQEEAIGLYEEALEIVEALPDDAFANRMEKRFRGMLEELTSPPEENA